MKIASLFSAAAIMFATSALAQDQFQVHTIYAEDKVSNTSTAVVNLPAGLTDVRVEANANQRISCTFYEVLRAGVPDRWASPGKIVFQAKNTQVCLGHANLIVPSRMVVFVTANNKEDLPYRILINPVDGLRGFVPRMHPSNPRE